MFINKKNIDLTKYIWKMCQIEVLFLLNMNRKLVSKVFLEDLEAALKVSCNLSIDAFSVLASQKSGVHNVHAARAEKGSLSGCVFTK